MEKKHGKKKGKKKAMIAVGLLSALIIILLVLMIIDVVNSEEKGEAGAGLKKIIETITDDAGGDDESEDGSEEAFEEEEEMPELMSTEAAQALVQTTETGEYKEDESFTSGEITVEQTSLFSGQFPEDGRDELVENVAAILVKNNSDKYLDLATLLYDINGQTATFVATGIPAGKSAWVMEKSRMIIGGDAQFTYKGSTTSFRNNAAASSENIEIAADGNMLTAVNKSDKTLENVCVYYKEIHDDGNYFGGITYLANFGTLEAGASSETLAGHYEDEKTEIVRIGWQEK